MMTPTKLPQRRGDGIWVAGWVPKLLLILLPWAAWITSGQFQDNAFRASGPRFTPSDANVMINSAIRNGHDALASHTAVAGHSVMIERMAAIRKEVDLLHAKMDSMSAEIAELRKEKR